MNVDVVAVLERAIAVLERDGWHQGSYGSLLGPKCIMGAIHFAEGEFLNNGVYYDPNAISFVTSSIGCISLHRWNDTPGRTYEDVVLALKQTIEDLT